MVWGASSSTSCIWWECLQATWLGSRFTILKTRTGSWWDESLGKGTCSQVWRPELDFLNMHAIKGGLTWWKAPWEKLGAAVHWGRQRPEVQLVSWSKWNWWSPSSVRDPSQKIGDQLRQRLHAGLCLLSTPFTTWAPLCTQMHRTKHPEHAVTLQVDS